MNSHRARSKLARCLIRDGDRCFVCKQPFSRLDPPTLEHIVECRDGGKDNIENLAASHRDCNNQRSNGGFDGSKR